MPDAIAADLLSANYELLDVLKPGATFLVRQQRSGHLLVLKRKPFGKSADRIQRRRQLFREVRHPRISTAYNTIEIGQTIYRAREYVEGKPVSQELFRHDTRLESGAIFDFAIHVARGLEALHRVGLVHANLHPGNLIIDSRGKPRIVDPADALTLFLQSDGFASSNATPYLYLSPEQLKGKPASRRSDLFCLGVIVYELVTGRHPFLGSNRLDALEKTLYQNPPPATQLRPELSPMVDSVFNRLLAKRPLQRYASARSVAEAFVRVSDPRDGLSLLPFEDPDPPADVAMTAKQTWRRLRPAVSQTASSAVTLLEPSFSRWRNLKLSRKAIALASAALLLIVVFALVGRSRERALAAEIESDISSGRTAQARNRLLAELKKRKKDALVTKLLGDVSCARKEYPDCLKRYRESIEMSERFASDETLRRNTFALLGGPPGSDLIKVLAQLDSSIESRLVEETKSEQYWRRWNSVRALEARSASKKIDYAVVYSMDLLHGGQCQTRRGAAAKLAQLKDKNALPYLKRAQAAAEKSSSERRCLGNSVERALKAIDDVG
jgi:serine/threonine protein kinase